MAYRPTSLRILGVSTLPISFTTSEDEPELLVAEPDGSSFPVSGMYDPSTGKITVNVDIQFPMRVLVHEMVHGYWRHMFEPRTTSTEEQACRLMETAIADLCLNNWDLLKALRREALNDLASAG